MNWTDIIGNAATGGRLAIVAAAIAIMSAGCIRIPAPCPLYTSDPADDPSPVHLRGPPLPTNKTLTDK